MESLWKVLDFRELGIFNSREIAFFIFGFLFVLYCLSKQGVRRSLFNLAETAFSKHLTTVYVIVIFYSSIPILILYKIGYWKFELLKDAVFWLIFSALPVLFKVSKADKGFFKKALLDNLKLSVIIDFVTSQYTFNVFVEIIIISLSLLLGGVIAFSEREEKYKDVNRVFTVAATLLGICIFTSSIYFFVLHLGKFTTFDKFQEFSLPIVLGIWFIPLLYFIHVYIVYDSVLSTLSFGIEDKVVRRYAQTQSIIQYKFDLISLKRWKENVLNEKLHSKEGVFISFLDVKRQQLIEKNPPKINSTEGWSPYESKDFLNSFGIVTGYYKKYYDDEWGASSTLVKLNDEIFSNTISYYVSGSSTIVRKLKVNLTVYPSVKEEYALDKFIECISFLYQVTFGEEIPPKLIRSIFKQQKKEVKHSSKTVSLWRDNHIGTIEGYSLYFTMSQE